jgi:integrase
VVKRYSRRARGEGAIIETADGRLRGKLQIPYPDGRQVTRWVSGRSKAEVSRKLAELKTEVAAGQLATVSTGDYLARWSADVAPTVRPSTAREYRRHVAQYWTPAIGDVPLSALTAAHVQRVMFAMTARGLSPRTVRYARTTLRKALGDAIRDGTIVRNAAALSRPPRQERPELRPLTRTEVLALLAATAEDRFGPMYALLVGSGLRIGEAVALSWTDVDGRELTVRRSVHRAEGNGYIIGEPKTRQSRRTITLPALARQALATQRERQDGVKAALRPGDWQDTRGLIFTDAVGRPVSPLLVSADFHKAADRLGLPVRLHDLRHTFATLALSAGVPLKTVSSALGHSSIAITADVYAHVTPELRDEAADAMDRVLS